MSETRGSRARRQITRLVLLTVGLAPLVAGVLIGMIRLQRDTPEWVFWKGALFFLIALEIACGVTAVLSLLGAIVLGLLCFKRRNRGASGPVLVRGLMLSLALLVGLVVAEAVCAGWLEKSHRATAVPVGGLGAEKNARDSLRFAKPLEQINLPANFPDPPGDPDIDLVVVGESSAEGVPYNLWVSIGKIIAWKLEKAIPGRPVRLHVLARAGDTLEKQHEILANLNRRPELLIIYCGHNEFYSRLFWSRNIDYYLDAKRPSHWLGTLQQLERTFSLASLIRETADKCRIAIPPPSSRGRDLVDVPVYTAAEYRLLATDFCNRLEEMVSFAERVGALPVLILPPGNDAGFEPNRSFLPPSTPRALREAFGREFLAARKLETVDPSAAMVRYQSLVARQPCFAETHYRLAHLLEQAGVWDVAYRHYVLARDLDGMPMRCPSSFQEAYRLVASRHGCILIDGQSYFHAIGRHGLLDDELFQDAMHPSLRGQIALAQAVLAALRARGALGWRKDAAVPLVDPAKCAAHFGIDRGAWRHLAAWWRGFNELVIPLRYDPSLRSKKKEAGIVAIAHLDAGVAPEKLGLPNVGIPEAVPLIEIKQEPYSSPSLAITPCQGE